MLEFEDILGLGSTFWIDKVKISRNFEFYSPNFGFSGQNSSVFR